MKNFLSAILSLFFPNSEMAAADVPAAGGICQGFCVTSDEGIDLIREFEGYSPVVYKDAAGYPTIGHGHLIEPGETFKVPMLPPSAEKLLREDVSEKEDDVNIIVTVPLLQHQFDAVVSITFNVGTGKIKSSTLLKRVNAERHDEVPGQFMRWVFAGGKKLRGLERRRKAEANLYEGN